VTYVVSTFLLNSLGECEDNNSESAEVQNGPTGKGATSQPIKNTIGVILAYIGKFFTAAALQANLQHTAELYTTDIRPEGMAVCSLGSRIGGVLAPFILALRDIYQPLPGIIFGVLGIVNSISYVFLPETLNQPMRLSLSRENRFLGQSTSTETSIDDVKFSSHVESR